MEVQPWVGDCWGHPWPAPSTCSWQELHGWGERPRVIKWAVGRASWGLGPRSLSGTASASWCQVLQCGQDKWGASPHLAGLGCGVRCRALCRNPDQRVLPNRVRQSER